ncbi:MAG TPA: hypothetical protein VF846_15890 [Thermoanaerobaculia bacterium]|jgi:hypothetical protein
MGWFRSFYERIKGAPPTDMTLVQSVPAPGLTFTGATIKPDECYVELYVESLRLTKARKLATTFNGVVYSFVSISREGDVQAQLAAVSKPQRLTQLDDKSLDKVITVSKQMMGPVPWRGGVFGLELGLFSVKTGNLLSPVLDYVTKVSTAAGVSFVGAVKPFLPLITAGMDLIAGQTADTAIEVGIDTDITVTTSGVHAIIDAPKGQIDTSKLSVDPADNKLLLNGKPFEYGYCVFSIRRADQKTDYGEIPELKARYAAFQKAIVDNKINDAKEALTAFRLAAVASPDLISSDARRLVAKAQQKLDDAFPAGGVSNDRKSRQEALAEIRLYG